MVTGSALGGTDALLCSSNNFSACIAFVRATILKGMWLAGQTRDHCYVHFQCSLNQLAHATRQDKAFLCLSKLHNYFEIDQK